MRKRALLCLAASLLAHGCAKGVKAPDELVIGESALQRVETTEGSGLLTASYSAGGESLATAPLHIRVVVSNYHQTPSALNTWLLARYQRGGTLRWYDAAQGVEACRTGMAAERAFVVVTRCAMRGRHAACAEADEVLPAAESTPCLDAGDACFEQICSRRREGQQATLQAALQQVLG